jgi:amidase
MRQYAHRPSHGIVPMRGFAPPMAPRTPISQPIDQSTLGPIARTAADLKMALDLVAGPDVPDSAAWRLSPLSARHSELKDFRVLVLDEHPLVPAVARDHDPTRANRTASRRMTTLQKQATMSR